LTLSSCSTTAAGTRKKKRDVGGLDEGNVNSGFGGAQPVMQDSVVFETCGSLGPGHAVDSVPLAGMARSMVVLPTDVGPFWMTVVEQN
jgi:hypothetical protein